MELSQKSIHILIDIKKALLSKQESVMITSALVLPEPSRKNVMITRMRHARVRNRAFQIMCQRGEW